MVDILLNGDLDIDLSSGDLSLGFSDYQQQEVLLLAEKGSFKESPDVGVGIETFLNDDDIDGMCAEVRNQFIKDGMSVKSVNYDQQTGQLNYDASY